MTDKPCRRCGATFEQATYHHVYCSNYCRDATKSSQAVGDEIAAQCWCGEHIVGVPLELVRACRTGSCGAPGCGPETLTRNTNPGHHP